MTSKSFLDELDLLIVTHNHKRMVPYTYFLAGAIWS